MTTPATRATATGLRPTRPPIRWKAVPLGWCCQVLDGQNTFGPISDTTAGTRVNAAIAITITAMARPGPIDLNEPNVASNIAPKAITTAPAAEAMASPTRSTETIIASFLSSPARSRSR